MDNRGDYLFTIRPTTDIDKLKKDKDYYDSLPYDQRRHSNDECIRKYGVTNDELYIRLLSLGTDNENDDKVNTYDDTIVSEAFNMDNSYEKDVFFDKIAQAELSEKSNGVVIICPISSEHGFSYTIDELNEKFEIFNSLSSNLRLLSDQESIKIFGNDVRYMYEVNKVKLLSGTKDDIDTYSKAEIDEYVDNIRESSDKLELYLRNLDLLNIKENGTIYESAIAQNNLCDIDIINPLSNNIPSIIPWFTPEEILNLGGNNMEFINNYKRACTTGLYDFNYLSEYNKVKELYGDPDKDQEIISLGWNPSVEPTVENVKIARNRLCRYINENYEFDIIDISKMYMKEDIDVEYIDSDLEPVFICLSYTDTKLGRIITKVTSSHYSHAAITLDPSMQHLYTFNINSKNKYNGIAYESINDYKKKFKDARIKVLCLFVTPQQKRKLHARLDYFISNEKNTKYDIKNLFNILFNKRNGDQYSLKMVCSQFVDSILKSINIDLTGKDNNLVTPADFDKIKDNKVYIVYEGPVKNYKSKEVDAKAKAISLNRASQYKLVELKEAVDLLFKNKDILLYKSIRINNESADNILTKINDILYVGESTFMESKKFPFKVSSDGSELEINLPTQIEEEYQKSHKLLLEYDKTNNYEAMKSELAKLWYLNNIAEKKIHGTQKKSKDKVVKTRARILNDFKKYLAVILKEEKNFNFTEYFNKSPYYDRSISIDTSTLKWSGKLLKSLIKPV